jgi:hypothetical protein
MWVWAARVAVGSESIRAKYPVLTHGFALSLGGEAPLEPEPARGPGHLHGERPDALALRSPVLVERRWHAPARAAAAGDDACHGEAHGAARARGQPRAARAAGGRERLGLRASARRHPHRSRVRPPGGARGRVRAPARRQQRAGQQPQLRR